MNKRFFDLIFAFFIGLFLIPLMLFIAVSIKISSKGNIIYWSKRIGLLNKPFLMPKFRTMAIEAPDLATHLIGNPECYLTPIGSFLRKTSFDELPQIWSILVGDMSFVGPRPALFNQYDLIELRTIKGVHNLVPGLTGWAQVNGRDDLSIFSKVNFDEQYLKKKSFTFDLKILFLTFIKVIKKEGVKH